MYKIYYLILAMVLLLVGGYANAESDNYYKALTAIKKRQNAQAENELLKFVRATSSQPEDLFKARILLSLLQIKEAGLSADVEGLLSASLCYGLTGEEAGELLLACNGKPAGEPPTFTAFEQEVLSAGLMAFGSKVWRNGNGPGGVAAIAMAAKKGLLAQSLREQGDDQTSLPSLPASMQNSYKVEQAHQQLEKELAARMLSGQLPGQNKEVIDVESPAMKQLIAGRAVEAIQSGHCEMAKNLQLLKERLSPEQLKQLGQALPSSAECDNSKGGKSIDLGRAAANEKEIFYRVAERGMCPWEKVDAERSFADIMTQHHQALAEGVELLRGNYSEDYDLVQPPMLLALEKYLDAAEQLKYHDSDSVTDKVTSNLLHEESEFVRELSSCNQRLDLTRRFQSALLVEMSLRNRNVEYVNLAASLMLRIYKLNAKPGSNTTMLALYMHGVIADAYLSVGQLELAQAQLENAFKLFENENASRSPAAHLVAPLLLSNLRIYAQLGVELKRDNRAAVQLVLEKVQQQFSVSSGRSLELMAMRPSEVQAEQDRAFVDSANDGIGDALGQASQLLENMNLGGAGSEMAQRLGAFKDLQIDPEQIKRMQAIMEGRTVDSTGPLGNNNVGANGDLDKIAHAMKEQMGQRQLSADIGGTAIEIWRSKINNQRALELLVSNLMLDVGDYALAKKWIFNIGEEAIEQAIFKSDTKSLEAYTRARFYGSQGEHQKASRYYRTAILNQYFYPRSAESMMMPVFKTPTMLLEEAADFELARGNREQAFDYIELARLATFDSPVLYGTLTDSELSQYGSYIKTQYEILQKQAYSRAKAQNQVTFYNEVMADAKQDMLASSRKTLSPLFPLYIGMSKLVDWLDDDAVHEWAGHLEAYNAIWEKRHIDQSRQAYMAKLAENLKDLGAGGGDDKHTASGVPKSLTADWIGRVFEQGIDSGDYKPLSVLKKQLGEDTSLVTAWATRKNVYSFSVSRDSIQFLDLPSGTVFELADTFATFGDLTAGEQLFKLLLAPHKKNFKEHLVFIVNGPLQNVAFAAMRDGDIYLGDQHLIRYAPSIAGLLSSGQPAQLSESKILVLDASNVPNRDKLVKVREEVEQLNKNFNVKVIAGEKVNKNTVIEMLPQFSFVHFSGHSDLDPSYPDLSSMALYNDSLYIKELKQLKLSGMNMVVLSSCGSAENASVIISNEFSALNAAFIQAGVKSVVATLHVVDDSMAQWFMHYFYDALRQGESKDRAVQIAQQKLRSKHSQNPLDWAAFILSGSADAVMPKKS